MSKTNKDDALNAASLDHTTDNIDQGEIIAPTDSKVEAIQAEGTVDESGENVLNGVGFDVAAGVEGAAANDPRVEARDIVRTSKTAEMAARVAEAGFGPAAVLTTKELINSVPASPAAGQPLDVVAYEEYTAEVAAQNAESAAAALKLSPMQRAQRIQELQRVSAEAYEG